VFKAAIFLYYGQTEAVGRTPRSVEIGPSAEAQPELRSCIALKEINLPHQRCWSVFRNRFRTS